MAGQLVNPDRIAEMLRPPRSDRATLSRDGRHLAYTVVEGAVTRIDIVAVDQPYTKESIYLGDTQGAKLVALEWTSPDRLVIASEDWVIASAQRGDKVTRTLLEPNRFEVHISRQADFSDPDNPLYADSRMPRPPRLLHLVPGVDDTVIVEGVIGDNLDNAVATTVRLDTRTGAFTEIDRVRITSPAQRSFTDRLGRYRLLEDRTRLPSEWRIRVDQGKGLKAWRPLDKVVDPVIANSFPVTRETLWTDRSFPLTFGPDPNVLYYASNLARDTFGIFAVDLSTGLREDFGIVDPETDLADPSGELAERVIGPYERRLRRDNAAVFYTDFRPEPPDTPLIFDRQTGAVVGIRTPNRPTGARWIDDDLKRVQSAVSRSFRDRRTVIESWDDARERFLVRVESIDDPGRYFVYERPTGSWTEFARRAPSLRSDRINHAETFEIPANGPDQPALHGRLALPREPLITPPPLICLFQDGPWQSEDAGYSAPAQMLAEFGCIVLQVDYRGSSGRGQAVLLGAREAPDAAAAADMDRAVAWLAESQKFDRKRIAAVGTGYGGWLALRAAQLAPGRYRCVVSLDGYNDLDRLFAAPPARERVDGQIKGLELAHDMAEYLARVNQDTKAFENYQSNVGTIESPAAPDGSTVLAPRVDFDIGVPEQKFEGDYKEPDFTPKRAAVAQRMLAKDEVVPDDLRGDFARWYFSPGASSLADRSVLNHVDQLPSAVMIAVDVNRQYPVTDEARALRRALDRARKPPEYWEVPAMRWSRPIDERSDVWFRVAEFFNENLYNFDVSIGNTEVVK